MNFVERARLLNRIAHHQDVDGPYALEFDAEGAQNWRDKGGLVLRFQLTQVFDIIWQHLQKRISFGGSHGLDQELLILGEKEEAAAPAAVDPASVPVGTRMQDSVTGAIVVKQADGTFLPEATGK